MTTHEIEAMIPLGRSFRGRRTGLTGGLVGLLPGLLDATVSCHGRRGRRNASSRCRCGCGCGCSRRRCRRRSGFRDYGVRGTGGNRSTGFGTCRLKQGLVVRVRDRAAIAQDLQQLDHRLAGMRRPGEGEKGHPKSGGKNSVFHNLQGMTSSQCRKFRHWIPSVLRLRPVTDPKLNPRYSPVTFRADAVSGARTSVRRNVTGEGSSRSSQTLNCSHRPAG